MEELVVVSRMPIIIIICCTSLAGRLGLCFAIIVGISIEERYIYGGDRQLKLLDDCVVYISFHLCSLCVGALLDR